MFEKKRPGVTRKTNHVEDREIVGMCREDTRKPATEIRKEFLEHNGTEIGIHTVRNRLREVGLKAHRPVAKPLISAKNREMRMKFAKEHMDWTIADWKKDNA